LVWLRKISLFYDLSTCLSKGCRVYFVGVINWGGVERMLKIILILGLGFILNGCSTSNPYLSMQPQIYKPDGYSLSVTRPGMATSTDTSRVANTYCDQFDRISSLTKLASPWIVPVKDEFICIEKDAEL
jgi:hypothetical protein